MIVVGKQPISNNSAEESLSTAENQQFKMLSLNNKSSLGVIQMKKAILSVIAALSMAVAAPFAIADQSGSFTGNVGAGYNVNGYTGTGGGFSDSKTSGGSMAETGSGGNGYSYQTTSNSGTSYAGAGAVINSNGASSYTNGGSHSTGESYGENHGFASGTTQGMVGQDFSSGAWSNFQVASFGGAADFSVGGGFSSEGGFSNGGGSTGNGNGNGCNGNSCGNHGWGDGSNGNGNN